MISSRFSEKFNAIYMLRNTMYTSRILLFINSVFLFIDYVISQEFPAYNGNYQNEENDGKSRVLPDGVNDGLYDGEGYAFYEHPLEEEADPVTCYTCQYSKTQNHEQGMSNCNVPFNESGIPTISCRGLCAVTKTRLGTKDYMIVRSCLPNCKDMDDSESTVRCCEGVKCNGRVKDVFIVASSLGVTAGSVFLLGLVLTICYRTKM